ncbi:MAG: hypothetical protein LBF22_14060 [Deltaproteobacteria bacterium]|nr:hypothetical protein [Deltaproteobacteria bacterium]
MPNIFGIYFQELWHEANGARGKRVREVFRLRGIWEALGFPNTVQSSG